MDDSRIISLYLDRSEEAISATAEKYGRYCHSIAFTILRSREEAEECVADTWLRTWNAIPPARPQRLQTFLGKITRNLALNRWEKRSARKRGGGQVPLVLEELEECIPAGADPAETAESLDLRRILDHFLAELPPETRKLFVRRYWYMSPVKEIAAEYGLTESKVTVTLFRAREMLRTLLEQEGITI